MDTIVDRMLLRIQVSTVPKREAGVLSWASTLAGFTVWRSFLSHLYWVVPPHSIFHQKVYAIKFQATKFVQRSSLQRHLGLSQGDWPFSHNPFEALIVVVSTLPLAALAHFDDKSSECENIRLERPSSRLRGSRDRPSIRVFFGEHDLLKRTFRSIPIQFQIWEIEILSILEFCFCSCLRDSGSLWSTLTCTSQGRIGGLWPSYFQHGSIIATNMLHKLFRTDGWDDLDFEAGWGWKKHGVRGWEMFWV